MMQPDIFWVYGTGSSFAVLAHHSLSTRSIDAYKSWPFIHLLLLTSLILVTCTVQMLVTYPAWETMHYYTVPPTWLLPLATVVPVLLAIFGFSVSLYFLKKGHHYLAFLQFIGGYFVMLFCIMHGWDGTGYQRFFSRNVEDLIGWSWEKASLWMDSDVAALANIHLSLIIPTLFLIMSYWLSRDGRNQAKAALQLLVIILLLGFFAFLCTLALLSLGMFMGGIIVLALLLIMGHPRYGIFGLFYRFILFPSSNVQRLKP